MVPVRGPSRVSRAVWHKATLAVAIVAGVALSAWTPARQVTPADQDPFFFLQLTDTQFGMYTNDGDFSQETANFEFAVAHVNRLRPAFVVITGDLVNKPGDPAQVAEYVRIRAMIAPDIPVYDLPGNHDIGNSPTPESLAGYRASVGRDRYVFQYRTLTGIVLNSTVIHAPDLVPDELAAQDAWLRTELANARTAGAGQVVVFQHHPWFLRSADEADEYFNIPRARRDPLLALFRAAGVTHLVSGHYHRNAVATADGLEAVTTAPVGKPLGDARSGFRAFLVTRTAITHRFYEFGNMPATIDPAAGRLPGSR